MYIYTHTHISIGRRSAPSAAEQQSECTAEDDAPATVWSFGGPTPRVRVWSLGLSGLGFTP